MKATELNTLLKGATNSIGSPNAEWNLLLTDSRKVIDATQSLFFAIPTKRNTGCKYIEELYIKGVRNFIVPNNLDEEFIERYSILTEANFWFVPNVISALQQIATYHRKQYDIPVIGITGSNGKTIVKDWLVQLISPDYKVCCSPKSYNSQIGVPLSVWNITPSDQYAIFEAGVSEPNEMTNLRNVISPTIGIFTNIGQAHDENFLTRTQKIAEKLQLFTHCQVMIYSTNHKDIHNLIVSQECLRDITRFTWGTTTDNDVILHKTTIQEGWTTIEAEFKNETFTVKIPFVDRASIENAMHCITFMIYEGYDFKTIIDRCKELAPIAMRLEMNEGINNSLLINDTYSLDLNSLTIALDFLQHVQHRNKTLIMSDFVQSGMQEQELYSQVAQLLEQRGINKFIGIGPALCRNKELFNNIKTYFYETKEDFLRHYPFDDFQSEAILLKGARIFCLEHIVKVLQRKTHETIMEVNLDALIHNLNFYRSLIKPTTKLMAMVKASSYGAGKIEIANALQYNHADYLTVAYSDEGVELRRNGIQLPIMVMNPEESSFDDIIRYNLEPDIYSFRILEIFNERASLLRIGEEKFPVHIEFDTGMHRLGFNGNDIESLISRLNSPKCVLDVKSIFSHLACAEDSNEDEFTNSQIKRLKTWSQSLKNGIHRSDIMCHILNSSGIERFTQHQMDMVRLGIGLYGISPDPEIQRHLMPVSQLRTKISQLKKIPKGESVGYNRRWIASQDSTIAIIPIGYADGLNRHLGYENGKVTIKGIQAPIIGSICMDMCFIDVTHIPCNEGDDVIIFGDAELLQQISQAAGTIPYEILTSVAPRVKRIYYQES